MDQKRFFVIFSLTQFCAKLKSVMSVMSCLKHSDTFTKRLHDNLGCNVVLFCGNIIFFLNTYIHRRGKIEFVKHYEVSVASRWSKIWAANLVRSPLCSRSTTPPLLAPLPLHRFFRTPAHRSAPASSICGPLRSLFRSDPAPLTCSGVDFMLTWSGAIKYYLVMSICALMSFYRATLC